MESIALDIAATLGGLFLSTLLFSRGGAWVLAIATAVKGSADGASKASVALATVLHSGPWLLGGVAYWAYHVLVETHHRAWEWFFGAVAAGIPIWLIVAVFLHYRAKRTQVAAAKEHAV